MAQEATGRSRNAELEKLKANQKQLKEALELLYQLLENHAPMWYTDEHREMSKTALRL